jgi:hypothetical protein
MRKLQNRLLREYSTIAKKHGVTPELVQEIESFQWKFVRDNMAKGRDNVESFENIYLRFLGTFHVSESVLNYINRSKERRDGNKDNKEGDKEE